MIRCCTLALIKQGSPWAHSYQEYQSSIFLPQCSARQRDHDQLRLNSRSRKFQRWGSRTARWCSPGEGRQLRRMGSNQETAIDCDHIAYCCEGIPCAGNHCSDQISRDIQAQLVAESRTERSSRRMRSVRGLKTRWETANNRQVGNRRVENKEDNNQEE
jgi:hypothetical protein